MPDREWWEGNPDRDSSSAPRPRENPREIILRLAAYRATHGGREPPRNSALARDQDSLLRLLPRPGPLERFLRLFTFPRLRPLGADPAGVPRGRPLRPFLVERAFLTDDWREEEVIRKLEAWPMVTAYRPEGRALTGEWFAYTVEVRAESRRQARLLLDCLLQSPSPAASGDFNRP